MRDDSPWVADGFRLKKLPDSSNQSPENNNDTSDNPPDYRVHSLYFVKNPYNPYMISCTDFRKSVHKIRTSVHKIRTSGFKSVHMLFKFYLFFTCHSCIWKVMSLEPYIFSQDIGWKKTVIWFSMKKRYEFCLNRV